MEDIERVEQMELGVRRVLVVDDSRAVQEDIRRILQRRPDEGSEELRALERELFERAADVADVEKDCDVVPMRPKEVRDIQNHLLFEVDFADQGEDGVRMVRHALDEGRPYMMAFVDMRMPPGLDGLETTERIWAEDKEIQIVICTAFSDHTWDEVVQRLGHTDRLLVLKKPFDPIEVSQLAWALTEKWQLARKARFRQDLLEDIVVVRTRSLEKTREELLAYSEELAVARDKARASSNMKSELLAAMTHEIRTPLSGVVGMTSLLMETQLDTQQQDYVETVSYSSQILLSVIDDILEVDRIESGEAKVQSARFELQPMVDRAVETMVGQAASKGVELAIRYGQTLPRYLIGDEARIRQILRNLLSNAIKFTHRGHVLLALDSIGDPSDGWLLVISVEDTGVGIPEDRINRIFGRIEHAGSADRTSFGGTGLGLSVSKKLSELMGGKITVASQPGLGSLFSVELPMQADDSSAEPLLPSVDLEGLEVLVISPHAVIRRILHEYLSDWQMCPNMAISAGDGLRKALESRANKQPIRLAIVDQTPSTTEGDDLRNAMRDPALLGDVPVIVLGDPTRAIPKQDLHDLGYAAYIMKPLRVPRLAVAMSRVMEAAERQERVLGLTEEDLSLASPRSRTPQVQCRPTWARVLVVEDSQVGQRVAMSMLEKLGCHADLASDGLQAVEMVREQDYDLILMDCQMPGMDGFETTRCIRDNDGPNATVPIVALTAHAREGDRDLCVSVGMNDYMAKPVRLVDLQVMIEKWLTDD